ncbi:hypothetical protein GZ77_14510 [Endozoicomonas montiporae]|uniref:Uncharacterized protein n=2 Tax=Endozoicomonas montiporae TaxID=1027273 RepID=A0A081N516_9GAMM|nr:hypothetical protein [Endozoicomonas montiporae]AMO57587.1 hypothetical protein EZMO1_3608 [Endozoicomonas montiporae CL-33]KEQ13539.1 hypothetical protein GZ77_14510 [Endozoicomonas montiporae]
MIWIIALVLLIILGNLFWLLPSRAERHRMSLRNKAIKLGLSCREIKGASALPVGVDPTDGPWLEYSLPIEASDEMVAVSMEKSPEGIWSGSAGITRDWLTALPDSVVRVICRENTVAVLWNERGEKPDVKLICQFLNRLAESFKWL